MPAERHVFIVVVCSSAELTSAPTSFEKIFIVPGVLHFVDCHSSADRRQDCNTGIDHFYYVKFGKDQAS